MKNLILKLKALIYRYTGMYLAHKEENDVIWSYLDKLKGKKYDEFALSLELGMWQAKMGLTTIHCPYTWGCIGLRYSKFKFLYYVVKHIELFCRQLSYDLERTVFIYWHQKKIKKLQALKEASSKKHKAVKHKKVK